MVTALADEHPMVTFVLCYSIQCEVDYNAAKKEIRNRQSTDSQDRCDNLLHCQTMACFPDRKQLT